MKLFILIFMVIFGACVSKQDQSIAVVSESDYVDFYSLSAWVTVVLDSNSQVWILKHDNLSNGNITVKIKAFKTR